jgi:hypothetical protein
MTNSYTDDLQELIDWLTGWGTDTESALETAAAVYQDAANRIEQLQAVQAQAKQLITDIFVETGTTDVRTPTAQVYVSKPGVTVSYDAKALDTLAAGDAEVAELLAPFRRQTERAGTLTIRSLRERAKGE